jgi:hypothetical protein
MPVCRRVFFTLFFSFLLVKIRRQCTYMARTKQNYTLYLYIYNFPCGVYNCCEADRGSGEIEQSDKQRLTNTGKKTKK